MSELPWAVTLLFAAPVAALLFTFFIVRRRKPELTPWPLIASCAVVAAAAAQLGSHAAMGWEMDATLASWKIAGRWVVPIGVRIDGLSAIFLGLIALVGGLVHIHASAFMKRDPGLPRFFLLLHLFFLGLIGLVVSNNFLQLYVFWEISGLCAFMLIGFWRHRDKTRAAALRAFMITRIGDISLLTAVLLVILVAGDTRFAVMVEVTQRIPPELLTACSLALFLGGAVRLGLLPFHLWLTQSTEAPPPAAAFIATSLAAAGLYLLLRAWPYIAIVTGLSEFLVWAGCASAIGAGLWACAAADLRVAATYLVAAQFAIAAMALGAGQPAAAVFHVVVNALAGTVLLLAMGNVAHALGQRTVTVSDVGGLYKRLPMTFLSAAVAAASLAGFWPFAGFYSRLSLFPVSLGPLVHAAFVLASALTAFAAMRIVALTFLGGQPSEQKTPGTLRPAEAAMEIPVFFLALGAGAAGLLGSGLAKAMASGWPRGFTDPALPDFSWAVAACVTGPAVAAAGALLLLTLKRPGWDHRWREWARFLT